MLPNLSLLTYRTGHIICAEQMCFILHDSAAGHIASLKIQMLMGAIQIQAWKLKICVF